MIVSPRPFLAAAALAALMAVPSAADAAYPGRNGAIAFTDKEAIVTVDANGGSQSTLVRAAGRSVENPAWSPNGKLLAFRSEATRGGASVDLLVFDGRKTRVFGKGGKVPLGHPTWSPDGARLAFTVDNRQIAISDANGKGRRVILDYPIPRIGDRQAAFDPAWSPSGDTIVFAGGIAQTGSSQPRRELRTLRPDGKGLRRLVTNGQDPDWSPDGRRIVFSRVTGSVSSSLDGDLSVVGANGKGEKLLTSGSATSDTDPAYSPDGRFIVFRRATLRPGAGFVDSQLMIMNADGTGVRALGDDIDGGEPDWRPIPR